MGNHTPHTFNNKLFFGGCQDEVNKNSDEKYYNHLSFGHNLHFYPSGYSYKVFLKLLRMK